MAPIAKAWTLKKSRQLKRNRRGEVGTPCFCIRFLTEVAEDTYPSLINSPRIGSDGSPSRSPTRDCYDQRAAQCGEGAYRRRRLGPRYVLRIGADRAEPGVGGRAQDIYD
jgi:hypothetical protein